MTADETPGTETHTISVVVPVYKGERTLPTLVEELATLFEARVSPDGHPYVVSEVLLVHDRGPDGSDQAMRKLAVQYPQVRAIWMSRNYGQHAATLAGMASSGGDWIVTMDEDGQHDPAYVPDLLDTAMREQAQVVYAAPTNKPPHGLLRNAASRISKWIFRKWLRAGGVETFQSYRLVLGEVGRSIAAYAGTGIYLDVAMGWVAARVAQCPVRLRDEGDRGSGYSLRSLLSHFWRLVISSGTRGLRVVSVVGMSFALFGLALAVYVIIGNLIGNTPERGWTSVMVMISLGTGTILFSLGIVAEYVGVAVNMAMGRPLYLITGDPEDGPLGRRPVSSGPDEQA